MACHKCSASFKASAQATCAVCGCKYHPHDCGSRYAEVDLASGSAHACPRCSHACGCAGGPVMCNPQMVKYHRQRRKDLAATKPKKTALKRKRAPLGEEALLVLPDFASRGGWEDSGLLAA